MEFASTPKNRLKYLGKGKKAISNESFLRLIAKYAKEGETFSHTDISRLINIIDTMCIMADNRCAQNEMRVKNMKDLLGNDSLHWLMKELDVAICTENHDYE